MTANPDVPSFCAPAHDDVLPFSDFAENLRSILKLVLQVAIHRSDDVTETPDWGPGESAMLDLPLRQETGRLPPQGVMNKNQGGTSIRARLPGYERGFRAGRVRPG
jgi:hypothetical protein